MQLKVKGSRGYLRWIDFAPMSFCKIIQLLDLNGIKEVFGEKGESLSEKVKIWKNVMNIIEQDVNEITDFFVDQQ